MDVAGKSDYDKAYAVCKWIGNRKNIKYNLDYAKISLVCMRWWNGRQYVLV